MHSSWDFFYFNIWIKKKTIGLVLYQVEIHSPSLGGCAGVCAKTVIAPFERIKLLYLVFYLDSIIRPDLNNLHTKQQCKMQYMYTNIMVYLISGEAIKLMYWEYFLNQQL